MQNENCATIPTSMCYNIIISSSLMFCILQLTEPEDEI